MIHKSDITAVILAGGRGRRMEGADKGLVNLDGRPLIAHILDAIKPQVGQVIINANRNASEYAAYGYPVIPDDLNNFQGPLAGFAAVMKHSTSRYIVTLPCDSPLVPADLVQRLSLAMDKSQSEIAVAHDGTRIQPVHAMLSVALLPSLLRFLDAGDRKVDLWYAKHGMALADFSDIPEVFNNINTPLDHSRMQKQTLTQAQAQAQAQTRKQPQSGKS